MHRVFVYETLNQGFPNFKSNNGTRYQGEFTALETYSLYLVGERYSPWLILDSTKGHSIKGQVFSVSTDALLEMDELERDHESDGYRRVKIDLINQETSEVLKVFLYGKPKQPL
ncbi:gamma-glutamylcyclotransferase family protein [Vibrio owensii]|uniref:gamma-glutamylcyclotransferase family protein n=1 Tax=Vibrio owensii TaxID=696485 RepID=UPI001FD3FAA4|nr:gamma-glutamylcyclotransferase family protein [Vibrio owensii]